MSKLIDSKGIQRKYGVSRSAAEALMRMLTQIRPEGLRKVYVFEADLDAEIERSKVKAA